MTTINTTSINNTSSSSPRSDVYTRVTARIVEQLEQGVRPWHRPWSAKHAAGSVSRPLRHNGQRYSGINVLNLWLSAEEAGFVSPYWLTFRQVKELGGFVRKGEHGTEVVYASTFKKTETTEAGEEVEQEIAFLKSYSVFCADQCDGLPPHYCQLADRPQEKPVRIEAAEQFFESTGADIRYGGNKAYYSPTGDHIQLPPFDAFENAQSHAATVAHELVHWTRHQDRLARDFGQKRFGDQHYAVEELVAELGSAFLCADLSITPEVRDDHAAYLQSWLQVLKADRRSIFTAASHASKAVDFLHGLQPAVGE